MYTRNADFENRYHVRSPGTGPSYIFPKTTHVISNKVEPRLWCKEETKRYPPASELFLVAKNEFTGHHETIKEASHYRKLLGETLSCLTHRFSNTA